MKTLLGLILAGLVLGSAAVEAGPIPTTPIFTNKLRFRIPFHYDADELKRLGAAEIRLYVSRDRGKNWRRVQSVSPNAGKFTFEASGDGEYWFIVRTVDQRNHEHPEATSSEPGLQVIVDTTPPKLQLQLKPSGAGKVELSWNASDEHLDPTLLRLEYMQPGVTDWEPLSVVPKAVGSHSWMISKEGLVAVRGSISDSARNLAQDEVQLRIAGPGQAVPKPRNPSQRQPIAGSKGAPFEDQALSMPDQFPGTSRTAAKPSTDSETAERDEVVPFRTARIATDSSGPHNSFVSQRSDEFPGAPVITSGRSATKEPVSEPEEATVSSDRMRVVNSRRFQIGYKLHDVELAGIDAVELYITQDHGATWYRYGVDPDKQSPAQIEVREAGTYGFALGVRTGKNDSTDIPQAGDAPALEVTVDETPPQIELLPLRQGRGNNNDKILIQWKYADEFPADLPIALYYAGSIDGPWQKISDWTENTGKFIWKVDANVPTKFVVRIEARDRAGNTQTAETPKPLLLNQTRPTAQFLGVEPTKKTSPK
jgi:hypothetical protein